VGEVYQACVRIDPAWCCQGVRAQSHRHIPRSQVYSLSVIARSKCGVVCAASRLAVRSQLIVVLLEPPLSAKTTKSALPCASSSQNPRKIRVPRLMQNARPGQESFAWVEPPGPALDSQETRRGARIQPPVHNRRLALHLVCIWTRQRFWTPDKSKPIIDTMGRSMRCRRPVLSRFCKKRGCDPTGRLPTRHDPTSWCYALRLDNASLPQQSSPMVELVFRGLGD
jgi:hypothetical protein